MNGMNIVEEWGNISPDYLQDRRSIIAYNRVINLIGLRGKKE